MTKLNIYLKRFAIAILVVAPSFLIAQHESSELSKSPKRVRTTTTWAACVPGSGQIINNKYWKAPIVLGAMTASVYFIQENTALMHEHKNAWMLEADDDPLTNSTLTNENGELYSETQLESNTYLYRRNRDLSYLSLVGIYLLQIIDANVDAHLRFFDANDDISFSVTPQAGSPWQVGLKMNF